MNITTRPATESDLANFEQIRGKKLPKLHKSRIEEQNKGNAVYLIVFSGDQPVGHVFINFKSGETYHDCPMLQDLCSKIYL